MGFPRDFLRESQRDGMAGRRPAPRGERGGSLGSTHKNSMCGLQEEGPRLPFYPDELG